jgi:hypothetical protein
MVSEVFLELAVAAYHCSCFPMFQFRSLLVVVLLVPSVHSQTKCSYVGLAHFGLLCPSFVVYAGRLLRALDWGGRN